MLVQHLTWLIVVLPLPLAALATAASGANARLLQDGVSGFLIPTKKKTQAWKPQKEKTYSNINNNNNNHRSFESLSGDYSVLKHQSLTSHSKHSLWIRAGGSIGENNKSVASIIDAMASWIIEPRRAQHYGIGGHKFLILDFVEVFLLYKGSDIYRVRKISTPKCDEFSEAMIPRQEYRCSIQHS
mgnify:FL=1